ncbi:MAG: hypothetical protein ACE5PT_12320 [Gemmatimonadales bacterium]
MGERKAVLLDLSGGNDGFYTRAHIRRAAKSYVCFQCDQRIGRGERYYYANRMYSPGLVRLCEGCGERLTVRRLHPSDIHSARVK